MRYQWVDSLKGLGIILVIATHTSLSALFPGITLMLTSGYMAMFFILSGYTAKMETFSLAIEKKAKRLLIPYFFYGVVVISLFSLFRRNIDVNEWIGLMYSRYAFYPLDNSKNILLLRTNAPLWFLTAMFISYIWFYIYVGLKRFASKFACIAIYIMATLAFQRINYLFPWSIDTSFMCALFIIVGYEFKTYAFREYRKELSYFLLMLILLAIHITTAIFNGKTNLSVGFYGNHGIMSVFLYFINSIIFTLLYAEVLKSCNNNLFVRVLAFDGKHSLRLMCIHLPLIMFMGVFKIYGVAGQFAIFIITIISSLGISIVIEKLCKRYKIYCPMLRYL